MILVRPSLMGMCIRGRVAFDFLWQLILGLDLRSLQPLGGTLVGSTDSKVGKRAKFVNQST